MPRPLVTALGMVQMSGMGGWVAFAQNGQLAIAMGNGSMSTFLTDGPNDNGASRSPDGKQLAVGVEATNDSEAYVLLVNAGGSGTQKYAPGEEPAWAKLPGSTKAPGRTCAGCRQQSAGHGPAGRAGGGRGGKAGYV